MKIKDSPSNATNDIVNTVPNSVGMPDGIYRSIYDQFYVVALLSYY